MSKHAIVVGGGLAGIASALLLAQRGLKVTIIEKNEKLGGLWQPYFNQRGEQFTQGVRIPETTGIEPLDELLFGNRNSKDWHIFSTLLKEGHIFNGVQNDICGCIDTTLLPKQLYQQGLTELLKASHSLEHNLLGQTYANQKAQLDAVYGPTFTEVIYRPLMKKFTGRELETLAPHTHRTLIPQRLKIGDAVLAEKLRHCPAYAATIAHESWQDLGNRYQGRFIYPTQGESATWVEQMCAKLNTYQVTILTKCQVSQVHHVKRQVTGVTLHNGERIDGDTLVWTLPAVLLANAADLPYVGTPPAMRDLHLTYLTLAKPAQTEMFYLTDFDASHQLFRATFLNNLAEGQPARGPQRVVLETFTDPTDRKNLEKTGHQVVKEFLATGLVCEKDILHKEYGMIANCRPVYTPAQLTETHYNLGTLQAHLKNVIFGGRSSTISAYLAPHVFTDVYHEIVARFGETPTLRAIAA